MIITTRYGAKGKEMDERSLDEKAEGLRALATGAVQQYSDDLFAGGEPVYPAWADDLISLIDGRQAEIDELRRDLINAAAAYDERADKVISVTEQLRTAIKVRNQLAAQHAVTEEAVSRFLGWRLPEDFAPDCGVSFKPLGHPNGWPVGTNLFTAPQARAMLEHVLKQPAASVQSC